MECSILLLADYANVSSDNKLNVMGVFTTINSAYFPTIHTQMYLVIQLTAKPEEFGKEFQFQVNLMELDGTWEGVPARGKFQVPNPDKAPRVQLSMILAIQNQKFNRAGAYEFSVLVDGKELRRLPLALVQISQQE